MPRRNPRGQGLGRGQGAGRGAGRQGRPIGTAVCVCPKCGHEIPHARGTPCTQQKCPKCDTLMRGRYCR